MSWDRAARLLLVQGTGPSAQEDHLLRTDVTDYRIAPATQQGENSTNLATFANGQVGYHKPVNGVKGKLAKRFGHDELLSIINECAAWRLARFMGPPYSEMAKTCVFRFHPATQVEKQREPDLRDGWGAMMAPAKGDHLKVAPLHDPAINDAVAFFDALIANQDRHFGNFRWEQTTRSIGLIDHGFSFPKSQGRFNRSEFLTRRNDDRRTQLTPAELQSLARIEATPTLGGMRFILEKEGADLLEARIQRMIRTQTILKAGER